MASGYVKSKTKQQQEHNRNTLGSIHGKKGEFFKIVSYLVVELHEEMRKNPSKQRT